MYQSLSLHVQKMYTCFFFRFSKSTFILCCLTIYFVAVLQKMLRAVCNKWIKIFDKFLMLVMIIMIHSIYLHHKSGNCSHSDTHSRNTQMYLCIAVN